MSDLPYRGAKVLYVRELNAIIKAYKRPIQLNQILPMEMAINPVNSPEYANNPYVVNGPWNNKTFSKLY